MRIQLGTSSTNAANYCLVYNYYAGVANPTTCTAAPTQAATGNNGNVMGYLYQDAANTSLQHSVAYTFDGVNRLASATAKDLSSNTLWAQSYIYTADSSNGQFGNMTCMLGGSGYCPQVTFSASTNRVSKVGSLNASHDPAGNMTGDGTHTYQWDAENRMVSVDSGSTATQNYNALGQRVERFLPNGSWTFDYLFGLGGEELGLYSAGTAAWFDQNVPMAGRVLVMYGSPSRFLHANNLGTTTVTTDQTGAELQDELFYPWGQDWTRAGQPYVMHFAGMQGFENPGLVYPTDFRRYNPALGRWMSPDPAGMAAADPSNPQSWNMYAYVLNNPVSNTDPTGLFWQSADDGASVDLINDYNNRGLVPSLAPVRPGSNHDDGTMISATKPPNPSQCRIVDPVLGSLEWTTKLGPEVQLGPAKAGLSIYKNAMTGRTGNKVEFGIFSVAGFEADNPTPEGGNLGGTTEDYKYSIYLFGFRHEFGSHGFTFDPSKAFTLGLQGLVGGELSFNWKTFKQIDESNQACRAQGGD